MSEHTYIVPPGARPEWVNYPTGFVNLVEDGVTQLSPWCLVDAGFALKTYSFLQERYGRDLFPIAHQQGSDDVACIERGCGETIKIINGFTSPGHENIAEFQSFWDWFRYAIDDLILFHS